MYVFDQVPSLCNEERTGTIEMILVTLMGRGGLVVKVFDFGGIDVGSNLVRAAWCPWTRHP